jgi:SAM-dependent methyltransferase
MLAFGRSLASEADLALDWRLASAEETGLGAGEFDVVTACQCWHWFDGPAAANEARRVLSPDGRVVVCGFDWLPLPQSVAGLTEELIEAYNPAWDLGGVRDPAPSVETDLASVGMRVSERFVWDLEIVYRSESWYRRIEASAGILSLTSKEAGAFGRELIEVLTESFGSGDLKVPHRVWGLISAPVG